MERKKILFGILLICMILLGLNYTSAYERLCLGYGDSVPEINPRYTCFHDLCMICVNDNQFPVHPGQCGSISGCTTLGETNLDTEPPNLTINSPQEGDVFAGRRALFEIDSNEPVALSYLDNVNGRERWKRLSSYAMSISKLISLRDGLNDITIKARDKNGNEIEHQVIFYIDSKKPKIRGTEPRRGFANGEFSVEFVEENPADLTLFYGNEIDNNEAEVDLSSCTQDRRKMKCSVIVELDEYDGQEIQYWFELVDIAGNTALSRFTKLSVDITPPEINNPEDYWWVEGRHLYFNIDITEENFDEVIYSYIDSRGRLRDRRVCSRLKDGICAKRISLRSGHYEYDVGVYDKAGNGVGEHISFDV